MIAALCVAPNSIYHRIPGVDAYDMKRDARTFPGGMPVVAHPPCRMWSAYCAHQAKGDQAEKDLGVWCAGQARTWGGILEQPAHSRLWNAAGLPLPGAPRGDDFTLEVWQAWWGYPMKKATWLYFSGIDFDSIYLPYRLHDQGADRRRPAVDEQAPARGHLRGVRGVVGWLCATGETTIGDCSVSDIEKLITAYGQLCHEYGTVDGPHWSEYSRIVGDQRNAAKAALLAAVTHIEQQRDSDLGGFIRAMNGALDELKCHGFDPNVNVAKAVEILRVELGHIPAPRERT